MSRFPIKRMPWTSIFSEMRRSSLETVNTSISLSVVFIGDLVISKNLVDMLLAAAVFIPFPCVFYGLVVFVTFFGGVLIFFGRVSIVVFFGGVPIVLEVNFIRKYMWCDVMCVLKKHKINKRKSRNKRKKRKTSNDKTLTFCCL